MQLQKSIKKYITQDVNIMSKYNSFSVGLWSRSWKIRELHNTKGIQFMADVSHLTHVSGCI